MSYFTVPHGPILVTFALSSEVRLTPPAVESEVKLIRGYSGDDDDRHVVEYIEFAGGENLLLII
jgi:hypothetical protein